MTWTAWVYATGTPADDGHIIAKSNNASGWQFKTSPDTGPHTFAIAVSSGGGFAQRYSTTVRALNTWYHVAGVYNATTRALDIYVNGVLDNGVLAGTDTRFADGPEHQREHWPTSDRILLRRASLTMSGSTTER